MERPRRTTPKKTDSTEMIGLLPEEEVAIRKALLASMQPEKIASKSPKAEPVMLQLRSQAVSRSRRSRGGRRGGRRGRVGRPRGSRASHRPVARRSRAIRIRRTLSLEEREPPRLRPRRGTQDESQFSSASPFDEPAISDDDESDGFPGEISDNLDSESNFSEEFESWTVPKSELLSCNQGGILGSNLESDLSSYEENESLDFQLLLSQSDSTTPNDVASPLDKCTRDLFGEKTAISTQSTAPTQSNQVSRFRVEEKGSVPKTEDFLSFLCMRQENEEFAGLSQCFTVTKAKGATRGLKNSRKRRCARKQPSAVKKLMVYKETDL